MALAPPRHLLDPLRVANVCAHEDSISFSCTRGGVPNVYQMEAETGEVKALTRYGLRASSSMISGITFTCNGLQLVYCLNSELHLGTSPNLSTGSKASSKDLWLASTTGNSRPRRIGTRAAFQTPFRIIMTSSCPPRLWPLARGMPIGRFDRLPKKGPNLGGGDRPTCPEACAYVPCARHVQSVGLVS
jgi:hypothetical protein